MTLPSFIIIGAAKAGTTALYWYLREHPQIHMSELKETNFFAYGIDAQGELLYGDPELHRFPIRTIEEYEAQFAGAAGAAAVGEASPIYLECPQTAGRIADTIPDARIICGLRNPVDRAYSDYLMYLRNRGRRFEPEMDLTPDAAWLQPESHWMRLGKYHDQLSRYFAAFPSDQIHLYLFDDLKRSATETTHRIYTFLGVETAFVPDLDTPHNIGGVPTRPTIEKLLMSKRIRAATEPWIPQRLADWARRLRTANLQAPPPLPPDLRRTLARRFEDDITRTETLTGMDLRHWLP